MQSSLFAGLLIFTKGLKSAACTVIPRHLSQALSLYRGKVHVKLSFSNLDSLDYVS